MSSTPQAPPHPRDWEVGVDEYLTQNGISYETAIPLNTGTSCYIWRLEGLVDAEASANGHQTGQPVIMKCADSTPKYRNFPVSPERLQFEVKALRSKAVEEACHQEPSVQVPRVLRETKNGFIMSNVGETDLRTAYKTINLGPDGWSSHHNELDKFYVPGGLAEKAIKDALNGEESEKVLTAMRAPAPIHTLTPWDFRPMNIVVRVPDDEGMASDLAVVDWELCHYGDPSNDVRMWFAEVVILEAKFGNRGLLSSFLSAYKQRVGSAVVDESFVSRVALSAGIYMLWLIPINPRVWDCTEEDVEAWKKTSLDYIRAGANGDVAWLRQSCLGPLLA
ncbi:phosphotransferase enzyme family protein [Colletotrichum scovillei]|uniref:Phosphotransferase enzyme family protein n=1 Tax=Colletotrichum scovillei TaxID=1209932 RepID=A0A9P7UC81_9PEZI|nr:phosphotransferase enzyme family protein [Colletotrichum scovillei]